MSMNERLRPVLYALAAILLLTGLWWLLKPDEPVSEPSRAIVVWTVGDGVVMGPELVVMSQGDSLQLQIVSDQADQLHIHGYEIVRELPAGRVVLVDVPLRLSGRFEIELHRSHQPLATLDVQPR